MLKAFYNVREILLKFVRFAVSLIPAIAVFLLGFSIQAQSNINSDEKASLFEGTIKTAVYDDEKQELKQYLRTNKGAVPIFLADKNLSGAKVSIKGDLDGRGVLIPQEIEVLEQPETNFVLPVSGSRTTAVILLNFINDTSQRISPDAARRIVFTDSNSANTYWQQASSGRLRLVGRERADGDVFGYLTLPFSNSNCTYNRVFSEWTPAAAELAVQNGINVNSYQTVIYVFPQNMPGCPGIGIADIGQIGDQTSGLTVNLIGAPPSDKQTITHEIGHNLGLVHSRSFSNCSTAAPFQNCGNISNYGDYDVMGGRFHLLSNYNSSRLGWLSGRTETFDSPGVYYISLVSPNHPAKRTTMAQIRLKDSNGNFTAESLFLEFRRQAPPFDIFPSIVRAGRGLSIRWASNNPMEQLFTHLFDFNPATSSGEDGMLLPGNTFFNSYYGISVTTLGVNPILGARVRIELTR
jgi:hypothetical protein